MPSPILKMWSQNNLECQIYHIGREKGTFTPSKGADQQAMQQGSNEENCMNNGSDDQEGYYYNVVWWEW